MRKIDLKVQDFKVTRIVLGIAPGIFMRIGLGIILGIEAEIKAGVMEDQI